MKRLLSWLVGGIGFLGVLLLSVHYIVTHQIPVLQPSGWVGLRERDLIVTCTFLMLIVVIPVFAIAWYFVVRFRRGKGKGGYSPDYENNAIAEVCWWGVPLVIMMILGVITWRSSHELNPFKPLDQPGVPLRVQVVALDWKWLFLYPDEGVASVNSLYLPVNRPICFDITADAPMNSFWIPDLGGMMMAMPGMSTQLNLIANREGSYMGRSSQISGRGFSGMVFTAVATDEVAFEEWIERAKSKGSTLNVAEYSTLSAPSEYVTPEYYRLEERRLYEEILLKYMMGKETA
ncbi:MAG: COX aromatic rich motif-containing protein [Chlamydiota bacterium]|nr:COX aromatic rich motif-containing protein [Chlamydiota bacterium]